jgi:hypothetical protein
MANGIAGEIVNRSGPLRNQKPFLKLGSVAIRSRWIKIHSPKWRQPIRVLKMPMKPQ